MSNPPEMTRREIIRTSALGTASTTLALASELAPSSRTQSEKSTRIVSPAFASGAAYFRKSNQSQEDWARDHATAAQIGMNTFRHWFMWSAVEIY